MKNNCKKKFAEAISNSFPLPDFADVAAIEEMLFGAPLCEDKLQGRLPRGTGHGGQEVQRGVHLRVHQVGEHQNEALGTNRQTNRMTR